MGIRVIPKLLLWALLIVSSLGTVSEWMLPEPSDPRMAERMVLEQQMAISAATNFARAWMTWSGEESPEDRSNRLKPYVNSSQLGRISPIQYTSKGISQKVETVQFLSFRKTGAGQYAVLVRVTVTRPDRSVWELNIPVSVQSDKGAAIMGPPMIRLPGEPAQLSVPSDTESPASDIIKQSMKPTIESFLKAMSEEKEAKNLANYVGTGSAFAPLQGRIKFISLDDLQVTGTGPYTVKALFTVQDAATGSKFSQVWKLQVTEENQKFFVQSMD